MKLGIIGLTNVGKTTLFNAVTKAAVATSGHLFSTTKPNVGIAAVPDERLYKLSEIFKPKKITPAYIEFVDIAGLVKGAGRGEGIGNKFLSHIREVDALIHVVRCFSDENVAYVEATINPLRDIETINLELMIADLDCIEKRISSIEKQTRNVDPKVKIEADILKKLKDSLEKEIPLRSAGLDGNDISIIKSLGLLTFKPVIYCANISENDINNESESSDLIQQIQDYAARDNSEAVVICAKVEDEIAQLDPEDKEVFMNELGIKESGLNKLVRLSYKLLGLISFLTAGPDEVRAWTIKKGEKAPRAAGKIHSDIERGFIRAETIHYDAFIDSGSFIKAKEKGMLRSEGKEYTVCDGDIIDFRFNV